MLRRSPVLGALTLALLSPAAAGAATTWGEYKKYFEKDPALARRFQVIKVEEPSEEVACAMLRTVAVMVQRAVFPSAANGSASAEKMTAGQGFHGVRGVWR